MKAPLRSSITSLLFNHLDAWGLTLMIVSVALLLHEAVSPQTLMLLGVLTLGYWLGFAINDYFDAPHDAYDAQKARRNVFVKHGRARWHWALMALLVAVLAATLWAMFGVKGALMAGAAVFILWAYSAPPLRLKSRAALDLLTHALFVQTFPYYATLTLINAPWESVDAVILGILFLSSLAAQLEQQARDYALDAKTDTNFTTRCGLGVTLRLLSVVNALFMGMILLNVGMGMFPPYLLPFGVFGLPTALHRFMRRFGAPRSEKLVFISIIIGMIYTGVMWSSYLVG